MPLPAEGQHQCSLSGEWVSSRTGHISFTNELNGHISVLRDAIVTQFGRLVVLHGLCILMTRSKVKVKVTEHLNFRQLPITAHFYVYLLRHFRVQLKTHGCC